VTLDLRSCFEGVQASSICCLMVISFVNGFGFLLAYLEDPMMNGEFCTAGHRIKTLVFIEIITFCLSKILTDSITASLVTH
jgi:hypothetical protein